MKERGKNVFWGVIFIAAAIFWLINELGYLPNIEMGHIVFSVIWGAMVVNGLVHRESFGVFMGLAFLAIVWDKELKNRSHYALAGYWCSHSFNYWLVTVIQGKGKKKVEKKLFSWIFMTGIGIYLGKMQIQMMKRMGRTKVMQMENIYFTRTVIPQHKSILIHKI